METKNKYPALVAKIENNCKVVINRGSIDGIKVGDKFLIYRLGDKIIDPENSRKSWGLLKLL